MKSLTFFSRMETLRNDILTATRDLLKRLLVKTHQASVLILDGSIVGKGLLLGNDRYDRIALRDNTILLSSSDDDKARSEHMLDMAEAYRLLCTLENLAKSLEDGSAE